LIYTLNKAFLLFFTGHKLRPPGIRIEATDFRQSRISMYYGYWTFFYCLQNNKHSFCIVIPAILLLRCADSWRMKWSTD